MTYTFNEHNVCTNPTIVLRESDNGYNYDVEIAQTPNGQYCTGYHAHILDADSAGCASPCSPTHQQFATDREAVYHSLRLIERFFQHYNCHKALDSLQRHIDYYDPRQLTLF